MLGSGYTPSATVSFGTTAAQKVTYMSPNTLDVVSPPGAGLVDIIVHTAGGDSPITASDHFLYGTDPSIQKLSVTSGPSVGGTAVTILGSGFTGATVVSFGQTPVDHFVVKSDGEIDTSTPSGPEGPVAVEVMTPAGISGTSASDQFTYVSSGTPPNFTSAPNTDTVATGSAFTFPVTTTGTPTPAITLASGSSLPSGVTLTDNGNGTATLAGTSAVVAGTYKFTMQAANGVSPNATQAFTLTVNPATNAPAFTSTASDTATSGTAFTYSVTTSGTPTPVITLASGSSLPSGVTLTDNKNGTATLAGTSAVVAGTFKFTMQAGNGVSPNATQAFTLKVAQAPVQVSLKFAGSLSYMNSGSLTSGGFTIAEKSGVISSVSGTGRIPGIYGGAARITANIQFFSLGRREFYFGVITVRDRGADLRATAFVLTDHLNRVGASEVSGTGSGVALNQRAGFFTLNWIL